MRYFNVTLQIENAVVEATVKVDNLNRKEIIEGVNFHHPSLNLLRAVIIHLYEFKNEEEANNFLL